LQLTLSPELQNYTNKARRW